MFQKDILLPSSLKIISEKENTGIYEIDGLYPGYGHTLGNSLRRVILSSIQGAAITKIKISGAPHEFTVIDGVREDVLTIVLNLKKVIFKLDFDEKKTLILKKKGQCEVMASDIELPTGVEIINPQEYLFSISDKNQEVEIEMEIAKKMGYFTKEELQKNEKIQVGEIVMDTSFSPVKRVSYHVDNTRVKDKTDFNKLTICIETDGSISPISVLDKSINIMIKQFSAILGLKTDKSSNEKYENEEKFEDNGDTIAILDLNEEILGKIANAGILKVSDLKKKTDEELLKIQGINENLIKNIRASLQ